jgi:hypothetical protein
MLLTMDDPTFATSDALVLPRSSPIMSVWNNPVTVSRKATTSFWSPDHRA